MTLFELGSESLLDPYFKEAVTKGLLTLADRQLAATIMDFDQTFKTRSTTKVNIEAYTIAGHLTDALFSAGADHIGGQEFLNHIASEYHTERAVALSIADALITKQNTIEPRVCPKEIARFKGIQNLNAELKKLRVKLLKPSSCA